MKLHEYPVSDIKSAIAKKNLTYGILSEKTGRTTSAIGRAINNNGDIKLPKLGAEILELLQPELSMIYNMELPEQINPSNNGGKPSESKVITIAVGQNG